MRAFVLLLALALTAGCTSLGKSQGDLTVLQDLAPFEVRVQMKNPTDSTLVVRPEAFRLVGADGTAFPGVASGREGALVTTNLGADRSVEGWLAFQVDGFAQRPLTLVYEADGVKLETTLPDVE